MPYNGNTVYTIYKQTRYKIFLHYNACLQIDHNSANRKRPAKYRNETNDRYGQWRTRCRGENEACCIVDNCTNDPESHGLDWCKIVRAERCGLEWGLFQFCCDRNFLFLGHDDLVLERIHIVNELNVSEYSGRCKFCKSVRSYERERDRQTETDEDTTDKRL